MTRKIKILLKNFFKKIEKYNPHFFQNIKDNHVLKLCHFIKIVT